MGRYTGVARALHWAIALMIVVNLVLGFGHDLLPDSWVMPVHKSIGLTVLALTLVRIGWRLGHPVPPLPVGMPAWEKAAAQGTHLIFYALMLVLPLSGWVMASAGKRPLQWFTLFDIPKFAVKKGEAIVTLSQGAHELLPWLWVALLALHVGAALRHQFVLKDGVLRRML
jgi:cytochrome b561